MVGIIGIKRILSRTSKQTPNLGAQDSVMEFNPTSTTIGEVLSRKEDFFVPKYQRSYAWSETELDDFYTDLDKLFRAREQERAEKHFFGGILVISHDAQNSLRHQWEIVDGQQRITSFSLLGLAQIQKLDNLANAAREDCPDLLATIHLLSEQAKIKWRSFPDLVGRRERIINKLTLSRLDNRYYRGLTDGRVDPVDDTTPSSHKRLKESYERAMRYLSEKMNDKSTEEAFELMSILDEVVTQDCQVLRIVCETRKDAYRLFQVLNDRGARLQDGDLLRNSTLEAISDHGDTVLDEAGELWDEILRDDFLRQANHLRWHYTARIGTPHDLRKCTMTISRIIFK
jgi:hypothetical protein